MAKKKYYSNKGGMIRENYSAMANLPQDVKMAYYPKSPYGASEDMDDTIRSVDYGIKENSSRQIKGSLSKKF